MNIRDMILEELVRHIRERGTQATHIMLPPEQRESLKAWRFANETPASAFVPDPRAADSFAGCKLVRGPRFNAWLAADPVYRGRLSDVYACRTAPPDELRFLGKPDAVATLAQFIVPAGNLWPGMPIYRAWFVATITLAEIPGVPPAQKNAPEMTHELMVIAADPNGGYDPDPEMPETWHNFAGKVAHQFNLGQFPPAEADKRAVRIAQQCAQAVTDGILPIVDVGDAGRAMWAQAIDSTVEHITTDGHAVRPS